jgi:hypothetical protein
MAQGESETPSMRKPACTSVRWAWAESGVKKTMGMINNRFFKNHRKRNLRMWVSSVSVFYE